MSKNTMKILLPVAILVIGVLGAMVMASSRKAPPRQERQDPGPLVEVATVAVESVPVTVNGHGEVVPKIAVDVVPQVAGAVIRTHPSLVAGGFFKAGEPLVVIEAKDYELAVERAQAAVAGARVSLDTQEAEAAIARQEWEALNPEEEPPSGLVVREPQVRQATAELAAAEADLDAARLNLARTRVSLPFDGVVVSKAVDAGQFVATGQRLARVYGTDVVEVRVPLEDDELTWFDLPGNGRASEGPEATVRMRLAGREHVWTGRVVRQEAEVDSTSRMVHVVIEVERPYEGSGGRPPLRPGSFVEVEIQGSTIEAVAPIPRYAVHEGSTVWVVREGKLEIRQVSVARSDRSRALIDSGLEDGDAVVLTQLQAVTDGMSVRTNLTPDSEEAR